MDTIKIPSDTREAFADTSELASSLRFCFESGHIWLGETRMVLLHGAAISALRKELFDTLGAGRAKGVLARMGFASGVSDAQWASKLYPDATPTDLVTLGPMLHMLEGIVCVRNGELNIDIANGNFLGEFVWESSFEADAHKQLFGLSPEPACWMQIGYASGYVSQLMGKLILFKETQCSAAGAHNCHIIGRPADEWPDAEIYMGYFRPDSVADHILALQTQVENLRYSIANDLDTNDLVGIAPSFRQALDLLQRAAISNVTVLLLGETGVGKEMFARAVHNGSSRARQPFIAINCAALPEQLIESELFGIEKGAYTGAQQSRPGRFERAHGGTLFLDEIGELPLAAQAKLLRVLQEGEMERVGDCRTRKVDVRVVAATNVNLEQAVESGAFRKDLYYRLNIYPVNVPPLRERTEDIPLLVQRFVDKCGARHNKHVQGVTDRVMHALLRYTWPGNIRELENVIERGIILAEAGGRIDLDDIFPTIAAQANQRTTMLARDGSLLNPDESTVWAFLDYVHKRGVTLDEVEGVLMEAAMERAGGNLSSAARALGITRPQLAYRLKKYTDGEEGDS